MVIKLQPKHHKASYESVQSGPLPEHDGGDGVDCKKEPDDKRIAVEKDFAVFQYGSESGHRDGKLHEAGDKPGHPVHCVIQAHHLHHLRENALHQPQHHHLFLIYN